jgi:predicted small secreted protein
MNKRIVIVTVALLALLAGLLSLTGCNTWKGAGKDVEKTGEAMQGKDK